MLGNDENEGRRVKRDVFGFRENSWSRWRSAVTQTTYRILPFVHRFKVEKLLGHAGANSVRSKFSVKLLLPDETTHVNE